jgi:hypothetical protein
VIPGVGGDHIPRWINGIAVRARQLAVIDALDTPTLREVAVLAEDLDHVV